ncbi:MAG: sialidase family protein [Verrucomicrobiota bacterium]
MKIKHYINILLWSLLITTVLASHAFAEPGKIMSEFIYETAPFPSCHASTIVETKNGLVAAWFGGTAERNPDVCIYVSRNENGKWTSPVNVADGVVFMTNRLPTWNPVLFQPASGPLMLFYKVGPSPSTWWGMLKTSTDQGKTWSQARRLPDGILGPIKNKPVQLANGDILCPSSTEGDAGWRVHFERSSDGGKTWSQTGAVNDGKIISAIQPSILFLGGEKLLAVGRTKQDKIFQVASDDLGQTWGKMKLTNLPNPNSGTDAVTLKDGRQLLVYNHTAPDLANYSGKGRSLLNLAVSRDGQIWQAALELENDAIADADASSAGKKTRRSEFSYPAIIQTRDSLIHITYTWNRQKIKHIVIDPGQLAPREMKNGQWPK